MKSTLTLLLCVLTAVGGASAQRTGSEKPRELARGNAHGNDGASTAAATAAGAQPGIVYVAKTGDDQNDGLSWQTAKLTVAAGVAALPTEGNIGSGGSHFGVVNIGPGVYVQSASLEFNDGIAYVGAQTNFVGFGTTIQLANNVNVPLFAYTPDFATSQQQGNAYSHYLSLRNLALDGNYQNNASTGAADDLVQILGGGYNTFIENVTFQNARRYGLYLNEKQVNFSCYTCTFGNDQGGAVYANDTDSGTVVTFVDTQLDNAGADAITINTGDLNYINGGTYVFINLKAEGTAAGYHNHIIRHIPAPDNPTFAPEITVIGSYAYSNTGADAMFYEAPGKGTEARWNIQNAYAQVGYPNGVFYSAKSGVTTPNGSVAHLISSDPSANAQTTPNMTAPDLQLSAGVTLSGGGNPSGIISAAPGSLYLDRLHGELWIKQSGTGNTGWAAALTSQR